MKRVLPILFATVFLLSACSGGNNSPSTTSASKSDDAATQASTTTDQVAEEKTGAETATTEDDAHFEEKSLEKIQGVWTSWGHSQSESWVIEDRTIHEYMALWAEDMSGPTDEYEYVTSYDIASVDRDLGKLEGEFAIRIKDSTTFYVYTEIDGRIELACHWDNDGYSGTDSMFKDDSKSVDMFPPAVSSAKATEVIPSPTVDISDCDTFTDIVNKLENEQGYANLTINDTDLLLVSSGTFSGLGFPAAIDAEIFCYKDGALSYLGAIASSGTAYPLSVKDDMLYSGGNHHGAKHTIRDGKLLSVLQFHDVYYDLSPDAEYILIDENGKETKSTDDTIYKDFYAAFLDADVIEFNVVTK